MSLDDVSLPNLDPLDVFVARDVLLELYRPPDWSKDGLCREHPEVTFFPARGASTAAAAKAVCRRCAVRLECLDYALSNGEKFGVWGGTSERERRHMRKVISASGRDHEAAA